jgi:hypothetical protein
VSAFNIDICLHARFCRFHNTKAALASELNLQNTAESMQRLQAVLTRSSDLFRAAPDFAIPEVTVTTAVPSAQQQDSCCFSLQVTEAMTAACNTEVHHAVVARAAEY